MGRKAFEHLLGSDDAEVHMRFDDDHFERFLLLLLLLLWWCCRHTLKYLRYSDNVIFRASGHWSLKI